MDIHSLFTQKFRIVWFQIISDTVTWWSDSSILPIISLKQRKCFVLLLMQTSSVSIMGFSGQALLFLCPAVCWALRRPGQSKGAIFGREVIMFPQCVHMIPSQLLEQCPFSYCHRLPASSDALGEPPLQQSVHLAFRKGHLFSALVVLCTFRCWGAPVLSRCSVLSTEAPAAAPPAGGRHCWTCHVSCTCGYTWAEAVPGQSKRWSSAPNQGVHPRRWVTENRFGKSGSEVVSGGLYIHNQFEHICS